MSRSFFDVRAVTPALEARARLDLLVELSDINELLAELGCLPFLTLGAAIPMAGPALRDLVACARVDLVDRSRKLAGM